MWLQNHDPLIFKPNNPHIKTSWAGSKLAMNLEFSWVGFIRRNKARNCGESLKAISYIKVVIQLTQGGFSVKKRSQEEGVMLIVVNADVNGRIFRKRWKKAKEEKKKKVMEQQPIYPYWLRRIYACKIDFVSQRPVINNLHVLVIEQKACLLGSNQRLARRVYYSSRAVVLT